MRSKMAAGNWKMNGTSGALRELTELAQACPSPGCEIVICPPATLLGAAAQTVRDSAIAIGGQDCHRETHGAHTGDISADMLTDSGATHVILGHSERRAAYDEEDGDVRAKTRAAVAAGLVPIICLGESLEDREADNTLDIISGQLAGSVPGVVAEAPFVIAYEPVWAIGTGRVATLEQIVEVHDFMRDRLAQRFGQAKARDVPLLYGGSVKPDNAAGIFQAVNVDGALVGGAALRAADFLPIIAALEAS